MNTQILTEQREKKLRDFDKRKYENGESGV